MNTRTLARLIPSIATSDGAGVKLRRSLGSRQDLRLDPFLMLDEFGTDNPEDYIAGFPPHPHRGFETVTYMIDGRMQHRDHLGNVGNLGPGDVQWMTTGRGIIHSEMPQQEEGRMRGFQLWLNLPAAEKMTPPSYRDIPAAQIPVAKLAGGGFVKIIAGSVHTDAEGQIAGPIQGLTTAPVFLDISLPAEAVFETPLPATHNAFLYAYEGALEAGPADASEKLPAQVAGILSAGQRVRLRAGDAGARVVLLAGKPLNEPVVQHGPFVMNTEAEIEQAIADFRNGSLAVEARKG